MEQINFKEYFTREYIDRMSTIFRVDHVLDMIGIPYYEKIGINRYYSTCRIKGKDLPEVVVNMPRNEWICREKGKHGKLSDLLDFLEINSQDGDGSYLPLYSIMKEYYQNQINTDKGVSVNAIRIGKNNVTMEENISYETAIGLSRLGISLRTLRAAGCKTATVYNRQTGGDSSNSCPLTATTGAVTSTSALSSVPLMTRALPPSERSAGTRTAMSITILSTILP